jgi:hypothetical protein
MSTASWSDWTCDPGKTNENAGSKKVVGFQVRRQERSIRPAPLRNGGDIPLTASDREPERNLSEYLKGQYDLQVIDIHQKPTLAKEEQIVAAPTLVKKLPVPMRRIIGDLSDKESVLLGLDLKRKS